MADTGWKSPGTVVNDASVGTKAWFDPDNAKVNDGNTSVVSTNFDSPWDSNYLKATNFGFSIPSGSTIDGIFIQIEERDGNSSGNIVDNEVKIVKSDGSIGTENKAKASTWTAVTTYTDYGGDSDLWSETWTYADINDTDFGVVLSVSATSGLFDAAQVDHIQIKVYYTEAATTETKTVSSKSRIKKIGNNKTVSSKSRIKSTGEIVSVSAKANIFIPVEKTQLVSPTDNTQDLVSPIVLVWELPDNEKDSTIHCHIQVDDTDNTFASLEHEQKSWEDQSNLEYFDGANWQPYPSGGVNKIYAGNQARLTISLTDGEKFWRVRGRVG